MCRNFPISLKENILEGLKYLETGSKNELLNSILFDLKNDEYMKIHYAVLLSYSIWFISPSIRKTLVDMISVVPDGYTMSPNKISSIIFLKK